MWTQNVGRFHFIFCSDYFQCTPESLSIVLYLETKESMDKIKVCFVYDGTDCENFIVGSAVAVCEYDQYLGGRVMTFVYPLQIDIE